MVLANDKNGIILSTAYLPPISYLQAIVCNQSVTIEQYENYIKQTYRNRCKIYAANGVLPLSIPVLLATNKKILTRDTRIDYSIAWQKQHFKSIESAYRTSPYFDFLIDDFICFYNKEYKFLLDFNMNLLSVIFDIIQFDVKIELSQTYEHIPAFKIDLRNFYSPKKTQTETGEIVTYPQVFNDKYGFQNDLSCIDLIFNLGPQSFSYLIGKY